MSSIDIHGNAVQSESSQTEPGIKGSVAEPPRVAEVPTMIASPPALPEKSERTGKTEQIDSPDRPDVSHQHSPALATEIPTTPQSLPDITIAYQIHHPTTFPAFTISSSTLLRSSTITLSDTPIAFLPGQSSLVIGSSTFAVPSPPRILPLASSPLTANIAGDFVVASQTAAPGSPAITVSGTTISIQPEASGAVINGVTSPLPTVASTFVLEGQTFTPRLASGYNIGSSTLIAGGAPIIVSGTPYSLASNGLALVVGSSTQLFAPGPAPTPAPATPATKIVTFDSSTYTLDSASQFEIAWQTLSPGSAITISGTRLSLASNAEAFVVGSSTQLLAPSRAADIFTFGGSIYVANSASQFYIAGQTLASGSAITVSGTPISLDEAATQAIVGSSAEFLVKATALASVIIAGFGGSKGDNGGQSGAGAGNLSMAYTERGDGRVVASSILRIISAVLGVVLL